MIRAAVIALVCVAAATPAAADDDGEARHVRSQAEMLFRAGERAFDEGKYAMAADAFERAFSVLPLPAIAFSAAQAYRLEYFRVRDDKMLKRAVQLYRIYVEKQGSGGRVVDAVANLAELEPMLERAEASEGGIADMVMARRTALVISSPVRGATGSVNGAGAKKLPFDVAVEAGRHEVVIEAAGYATWKREVDVIAGQTRAVEGELVPLKVAVAVDTDEGAEVRVDGERVGVAPLGRPLELDAGEHLVTVTRRGHVPFTRRITGERGQSIEVDAELSTTRQRKLAWAMIGTGGVFVVGGVLAGLVAGGAQSRADELDDLRRTEGLTAAQLAEYQDKRDERDQARAAAFGALATGAVVGGIGALFYFLDNPSPPAPKRGATTSRSLELSPVIGPEQAGVALGGRF